MDFKSPWWLGFACLIAALDHKSWQPTFADKFHYKNKIIKKKIAPFIFFNPNQSYGLEKSTLQPKMQDGKNSYGSNAKLQQI